MIRFAVAAIMAAGLFTAPAALAQQAPDDAVKTLWCSIAFTRVVDSMPEDANEEDLAMAEELTANGATLLGAAEKAYGDAGFSAEQFSAALAELEPAVVQQINGPGDDADYSFDDCMEVVAAAAN